MSRPPRVFTCSSVSPGRAAPRGKPRGGGDLVGGESRPRVTAAKEAAPVDPGTGQADPPDVEPLAAEILGRAGELHVVVEGHASREALRRHDSSLSSASRLRQRIFSFSSSVTVFMPWSHVTGEGCHGTKGQSLPSTTRSAPTSSSR